MLRQLPAGESAAAARDAVRLAARARPRGRALSLPAAGVPLPARHNRVSTMAAPATASATVGATATLGATVEVEAVTDPMCPWCYIGMRRMQEALRRVDPAVTVRVTYVPFVFDPHTPVPHLTWLDAESIITHKLPVTLAEAASVGLDFRGYEQRRMSPTVNSLRLLHFGRAAGREAEVVEQIFAQHFVGGKDTGDLEVLADCAAAAGLDREAVRVALRDTDEGRDWVLSEDRRARRSLHVSGVPTYILRSTGGGGALELSGAVPADHWLEAIDALRMRAAAASAKQATTG